MKISALRDSTMPWSCAGALWSTAVVAALALIIAYLTGVTSDATINATAIEAFHQAQYIDKGLIKSWEEGAHVEALLELHNPELTVFGSSPFPGGLLPALAAQSVEGLPGLASAAAYIWTNGTLLSESEGESSQIL